MNDRTGTFHLPAQAAIESSELWANHMRKILDLARLITSLIDEFGEFTFCVERWPRNDKATRARIKQQLTAFGRSHQLIDVLRIGDGALQTPEFDIVRPVLQEWFRKNWHERAKEERDLYVWLLEGDMGSGMFTDVIAVCGGTQKLKAELARVLVAEYGRHLIL